MASEPSIITIGFSPAWDINCRGRDLEWGKHQHIDKQTILPAGKAFNISCALAWTGQTSIAAGLWGSGDYEQMKTISRTLWPLIDVNMTVADGETRRNVTIIDIAKKKEMHLRSKTELLSKKALRQFKSDLGAIVKKNSLCVFTGAMPEDDYLNDVIEIVKKCHESGAKIVLDTSGPALKKVIETGLVWMAKPNVLELGELFNRQIEDNPASLIKAGRELLAKVGNILISRGKEGAILLNNQGIWQSRCINRKKVLSTVGCGDYLLAGFIKGWKDTGQEEIALSTAVKVATVKAWGWVESMDWPEAADKVQIKLSRSK